MKRGLLIAGLIFLGSVLVFLNQGLKKSAMSDHDENEKRQSSQAQKTPSTPSDPKSVLPSEETVGEALAGQHRITAGWVYDEANQQKPETLTVPIQTIHELVGRSAGIASAEIVNLDVPVEDRTPAAQAVTDLGVRVDGQPLSEGNLSDAPLSRDLLIEALQRPVPKK